MDERNLVRRPSYANQENREADSSPFEFFLFRGLEDVKPEVWQQIGGMMGVKVVDLDWRDTKKLCQKGELSDSEILTLKMEEFDAMVTAAKDRGKEAIIIGVSAGAAWGLLYTLTHPNKVAHFYSVSGLLNTDINKIGDFTEFSPIFKLVVDYFDNNLSQEEIGATMRGHLADRISVYASEDDLIVPTEASHPKWVKKENFHYTKGDHVTAIVNALITDVIPHQIKPLKGAKIR